MVLTKALILASLGITILATNFINNNQDIAKYQEQTCSDDKLTLKVHNGSTLKIPKEDMYVEDSVMSYEIKIIDESIKHKLKGLSNPLISFCFNDKLIKAYPLPVTSSGYPEGADHFYTVNLDGIPMLIGGILYVHKVKWQD